MTRGLRQAGFPAAVAVAALLTFAGLAAAVAPVRGAHYKGHLSATDQANVRVTFTVSTDGKSVRGLHVGPYPPDTCGGGGPVPHQASSTVPIRNGAFTAHVTYRGVTGSVISRMTVTGQFLAHGKERGVVDATPTHDPKCGGSFKYTTTGSATISAHLSSTSFLASKAASVRLTYRFSATSRRFGYLITIRTGSGWQTVKSVTRRGSFSGSHTTTVTKLFAGTTVKAGTYRLKLSADGGSKVIGFTVKQSTTPPPPAVRPRAGTWVTTSLSDAASGAFLTITSMSFTVGADQATVSRFGFGFTYSGTPAPPTYNCSGSGFSGMTSDASSPITEGKFSSPSPTGAWSSFVSGSATGTFDAATTAHGTAEATGTISGAGCYATSASAGPFDWTAAWQPAG